MKPHCTRPTKPGAAAHLHVASWLTAFLAVSARSRDAAPVIQLLALGASTQLEIGARLARLDVVLLATNQDLQPSLSAPLGFARQLRGGFLGNDLAVRLIMQIDRIDLPFLDLDRCASIL